MKVLPNLKQQLFIKTIVHSKNSKQFTISLFKMSSDTSDDPHHQSRSDEIPNEIIEKWDNEQNELKQKLILNDCETWQTDLSILKYIAGVDISYPTNRNDVACAGLVVFEASTDDLKVVYEDIDMVNITQPYVPGYLAFREAPILAEKLFKLKQNHPNLYPQCIFIDGNGILHPKQFGLACHLGVLTDTPTIGCAKKLFQIDGLENNDKHKKDIKEKLLKKGDYFELRSNKTANDLLGYCYRTEAQNPIYVSIGHKICWQTALLLIGLVTRKYRVPEPIRQADLRTREYLRTKYAK